MCFCRVQIHLHQMCSHVCVLSIRTVGQNMKPLKTIIVLYVHIYFFPSTLYTKQKNKTQGRAKRRPPHHVFACVPSLKCGMGAESETKILAFFFYCAVLVAHNCFPTCFGMKVVANIFCFLKLYITVKSAPSVFFRIRKNKMLSPFPGKVFQIYFFFNCSYLLHVSACSYMYIFSIIR